MSMFEKLNTGKDKCNERELSYLEVVGDIHWSFIRSSHIE